MCRVLHFDDSDVVSVGWEEGQRFSLLIASRCVSAVAL
jgi:hypothetical protein